MNTITKYFGDLSYKQEDILFLKDGLYGFESYHKYLLIRFEADNPHLLCLQSLEEGDLAFVLVNPFTIVPEYYPVISEEDMKALELTNDSEVSYYSLCVIREPLEQSTVNLKCPLVINPAIRYAKQIILEEYSLKHPFGHHELS